VAVFTFLLLAGGHAEWKGGYRAMGMDTRDPWKDMRTTSLWVICAPASIVTGVPVVS